MGGTNRYVDGMFGWGGRGLVGGVRGVSEERRGIGMRGREIRYRLLLGRELRMLIVRYGFGGALGFLWSQRRRRRRTLLL